jgi:hypothetical protein
MAMQTKSFCLHEVRRLRGYRGTARGSLQPAVALDQHRGGGTHTRTHSLALLLGHGLTDSLTLTHSLDREL